MRMLGVACYLPCGLCKVVMFSNGTPAQGVPRVE